MVGEAQAEATGKADNALAFQSGLNAGQAGTVGGDAVDEADAGQFSQIQADSDEDAAEFVIAAVRVASLGLNAEDFLVQGQPARAEANFDPNGKGDCHLGTNPDCPREREIAFSSDDLRDRLAVVDFQSFSSGDFQLA